jgi:g-D-glutamyl-meso-diaminopimelate peptidase
MHANESITSKLLMAYTEKILKCQADLNSTCTLDTETTLWIVPMVNPDGVELVSHGLEAVPYELWQSILDINEGEPCFENWKANIRGVDINDQFPAYWDEEVQRRDATKPSPANYTGRQPLSEPEARAMAEFTLEENFDLAIAWHTQGEEIYWGYRGFEPPESELIAQDMAKSSGYEAIQYVDSDAGYKDWFIMRLGRPAFTVECGLGVNPLPLDDLPDILDRCRGIFLAGLKS